MRPRGSPKGLAQRRFYAIAQLREGKKQVEVAREVGVDPRSVRRWDAAYEKNSADAIRARPIPGRSPKLDTRTKEELRQLLLEGAKASGFPTDIWTCSRVGKVILLHFGVQYHVAHVGRLLHALGWCRQIDRDEMRAWGRSRRPRKRKPRPRWGPYSTYHLPAKALSSTEAKGNASPP